MTTTRYGYKDPRAAYGDFQNDKYATDAPSLDADLFNRLASLLDDTVAKGAPRAQDTPDMTICVSAFVAYVNGALVSFAGGNSAAMVAPTANPRIDRVYLTDAGALAISTGSEAGSPTAPALVANTVPICLIYHRVGSVHIDDADDSTNSYIYRDDRPLYGGVSTPSAVLDTIGNTEHHIPVRGAAVWETNTLAALITALSNDVTQADGKYIATDKVRARDGDGLILGSENGEEVHIGEPGLKFDGTDDYTESDPDFSGDELTVEILYTPLARAAYNPALFAYYSTTVADAGGFSVYASSDYQNFRTSAGASGYNNIASSVVPDIGEKYHAIFTYDKVGNAIKAFKNGVQTGDPLQPGTVLASLTNHTKFRLGNSATRFGNMIVYRVRVWKRILTGEQITAAAADEAVAGGDPYIHYDMSDGSGTTLTDSSGNANHGTLTNFADTKPGAGNFGTSGWVAGTQVDGDLAVSGSVVINGELLRTSFRYVFFLPQSFGYPATNPADKVEWAGTNTTRQEARFDDTTEEFVTGGFPVPADYDSSGTITIMVIGRSLTAAASKNVAFTFRHLPLADSEAMDAAYTSSASGDSATDATQDDLEVHSWTVGTPGWTAGDWVDFKLSRNPSATDDLTGDWCLRSMILKIPVTG